MSGKPRGLPLFFFRSAFGSNLKECTRALNDNTHFLELYRCYTYFLFINQISAILSPDRS